MVLIAGLVLMPGGCPAPTTTANLDLTTSGQGSVAMDPDGGVYDPGATVTLTAAAEAGWTFSHWDGDLTGNVNPAAITMDVDKQVTAVFTQNSSNDCVEWEQTDIATDTTIPAGCWLVNTSMNVHANATLTLSPGATLQFASGRGLYVASDGALIAAGSAASPIILTGQTEVPGSWIGLRFDQSDSLDNSLQYVTVEYGGADSGGLSSNLMVSGASRVSISHCSFTDGSTFGFTFRPTLSDVPTITTFDSNVVTHNHSGAGEVPTTLVGVLTTTSTYDGNTTDMISVSGGNSGVDQTWQAIGVDYVIRGTVTVDHHTTVAPGVHMVFKPGLGLYVTDLGALTAVGTAADPILITCQNKAAGAWVGVRFDSNTADNLLQYATVEYGGHDSGGLQAGILVDISASATIQHCTIQYSSSYGIRKRTLATLTQSSNTFVGNGAADIQLDP